MNKPSRIALSLVVCLLSLGSHAALFAGGGPENVAVVVNSDSFASQAVANTFVEVRQVPAANVIHLSLGDLPNFEIIDVETFRERILKPTLETLDRRGLAAQIDCVAYSADVPYAVRVNGDVGETNLPKVITQTAAVNGLTYLYPLVLAKKPEYLSLGINFYARLPQRGAISRLGDWSEEQRQQYVQAIRNLNDKDYAAAAESLAVLVESHPQAAQLWYNQACALARLEKPDEAMESLRKAVETGWFDGEHTRNDEDLSSLREREDFQKLVAKLTTKPVELRPTLGFRGVLGWNQVGEPVPPDAGMRYLLSTMLSVTSGRGLSVNEAIANLRRSAAADGTFPTGTVYLMDNSDIRSRTRKPMFADTVKLLESLQVEAEVVAGKLPPDKDDVTGLVAGSATFDWPGCGSQILPGAICEHLTSTGGVMHERGGQTPISEFLRHGAAGTSGTVTEPYAINAKFPLPYMHAHYAQGCSLAEAFYQSVSGPYQLLIVGDPLCAPWASRPSVTLPELPETLQGEIQFTPTAEPPAGKQIGRFDLFVDGQRRAACPAGGTLTLDTQTLADGEHEFRLVAVINDPIQIQGRAVWSHVVDNHGRTVSLDGDQPPTVAWGDTLRLRATANEAATRIELQHQGRVLAKLDGSQGEFTVKAARLGLGRSELVAAAFAADDQPAVAASKPIRVTVSSPPPLHPTGAPQDAELLKGIAVLLPDKPRQIVEETHDANWLESLGVTADDPVTLEGYFEATREDLYQFQLRSPRDVSIRVDNTEIYTGDHPDWQYIPVQLGPGTHHLQIEISGTGPPRVEVRFGGPGSYRIGARHFRAAAG